MTGETISEALARHDTRTAREFFKANGKPILFIYILLLTQLLKKEKDTTIQYKQKITVDEIYLRTMDLASHVGFGMVIQKEEIFL